MCRHDHKSVLGSHSQLSATVYSPNSTWLVSTRLDTTRRIRRVEPMHFGCVELVEQRSSTRSTRRARHVELDSLEWHDTSSSTGSTRRARQARLAT